MMRRALAARLRSLRGLLQDAVREWVGDRDYERYVAHCAAHYQTPMDRGRYFAARLEERYRGTSRCC